MKPKNMSENKTALEQVQELDYDISRLDKFIEVLTTDLESKKWKREILIMRKKSLLNYLNSDSINQDKT